jgi:hypothetical protein
MKSKLVLVSFLLLVLHICCAPVAAANTQHEAQSVRVSMFIRDDVYNDYQAFLAGRDVHTITSFTGYRMRRDVVDMVLALQAMRLGGFHVEFDYHIGKITLRNTNILERGEKLISFDTYWLSDANALGESVYVSDPVFEKGEYVAGVFAHPSNQRVFSIKNKADFKQLTAISSSTWSADWQTLSELGLKQIFDEKEWVQQVRAVDKKWADFVLMPLMPAINNDYKLAQVHLKAVPGVVVSFADSRHYVVSRKHPYGEKAFNALQKGLSMLKQQGRIKQAYVEAGFIPEAGTVTVLNQQ